MVGMLRKLGSSASTAVVESKSSNSERCQFLSDPLDVRAAVATAEPVHQDDEWTAWPPVVRAIVVQHQDIPVGKVDAMADG